MKLIVFSEFSMVILFVCVWLFFYVCIFVYFSSSFKNSLIFG